MPKHGIIIWPKVLYPVKRAPHAAAISRAIDHIVSRMRPPSFCYCGKNCAVNRKHVAALRTNVEGEK